MYDQKLGWVHHTCINWMDEVWFTDDTKSAIEGKPCMDKFKLQCSICRDPKLTGYCFECDYKQCKIAFHIRCAIDRGLI